MPERWSSQDNVNFMDLYKEQENLWNTFDPNYKNRDFRKASLEHIAKEMNLANLSDVTKKIKNLRSTYNQELLKIAKSKKSGSGTDETYKPSIKWFDTMDYIMKIINLKEKETTSNMPKTMSDETQEENQEIPEKDPNDTNCDASSTNIHVQKQDCKNGKTVSAKKSLQTMNVTAQSNAIQDAINELKQLNSNLTNPVAPQQEDECDLIGKHIAFQLRQLPLLEMIDAKDEIQQILSGYRKRNLYTRDTSTPLSMHSHSNSLQSAVSPPPQVQFSESSNSFIENPSE